MRRILIEKLDGNQVNTRIAKCDAKLTAFFPESVIIKL